MALVAYVFSQNFAGNAAGDIVQLDPEQAQALVDAGVLEEATQEHIDGQTDEAPAEEDAGAELENAALTRAFNRLETSIAKATEVAVSKVAKNIKAPAIPATAKEPVFKSMGQMLQCQYKAVIKRDVQAAKRLAAYAEELRLKSPLGANEGTAGDGGYTVKPDWMDGIWTRQKAYPDLLSMTDQVNISGNTYNMVLMPEASTADGVRHAGVRAYYVAEGATATASYPQVDQQTLVLDTLVALVHVTDQLLQDSNVESFEKYIKDTVALEFAWQFNDAVVNGSGASGYPKGILNQDALVTVSKESAQTAATVNFQNISKMYKALYPASRANAVWLMNPEIWHSLVSMTFPTASGTASAFGGLTFSAHDEFPLRIYGKPAIECLNCSQLGNAGDIILADLKALTTPRHPGMESAVSTELNFTSLQTSFRFVSRFTIGSPWKTTTVSKNMTYSPFVICQGRGT